MKVNEMTGARELRERRVLGEEDQGPCCLKADKKVKSIKGMQKRCAEFRWYGSVVK